MTRPTVHLAQGPWAVSVEADDPAPLAWLQEFLVPWFRVVPGTSVADGAPRVTLTTDPALPGRLRREGRRSGGRGAACFLLDERVLRYPRWRIPGSTERWIEDTDQGAWYRPGPDGVAIAADRDGRGARVALLRVVRELAMHAAAARGEPLLHAAGAAREGAALLLCGAKRSGKTTLLLRLLAEPGVGLLANDRVHVRVPAEGGPATGRGSPTIVSLRPGTLELLPILRDRLAARVPHHARTLAEASRERHVALPSPAGPPGAVDLSPAGLCALTGAAPIGSARVAAIVVPVVEPGARDVRLERLDRPAALAALRAGTIGPTPRSGRVDALAVAPDGRDGPKVPVRLERLARLPVLRATLGRDAITRAGTMDPLLDLLG